MSREVLMYAVGEDGTARMSVAFGGSDYRVPTGPGSDAFDRLVGVLGAELALKLVAMAGGDVLYVPRNHGSELDARNQIIARMLEQGMTPGEIARKFTYTVRVSERHVYRIMERLSIKRSDAQRDLFGPDCRQDN